MTKSVIVAYIPVLHKGYEDFLFEEAKNASALFIIGDDVIAQFPEMDYLKRKDTIRALSPALIKGAIEAWDLFDSTIIMNRETVCLSSADQIKIVMPDEDISRAVAKKYFNGKEVRFVSVFLRWHLDNVGEEKSIAVHRIISLSHMEKEMMNWAVEESQNSWDWWRQVGAVIITENKKTFLSGCNNHVPDKQMPYAFGDPRSIFKRGINIELSTAAHAETMLIAHAAKLGISLEGAHIFVTDFPCPPCAKLIAYSGIKKCYFKKGYSILDGEDILKSQSVEIIRVE